MAPWQGGLTTGNLIVPLLMHLMHFKPPTSLPARIVRRIFRRRLFVVRFGSLSLEGRYAEYADLHAIQEVFLERAYELAEVVPSPDCLIDLGAHIGTFAVLAGKAFPHARLVAFEPDPDNFTLLERNTRRNGICPEVHLCAIGEGDGIGFLAGPSSMGRRLGPGLGLPVSVRRLSAAVELDAMARLLLKIDVEGAEWAVLRECGDQLPYHTIIFIETHGGAADLNRLRRFATDRGFTFKHARAKGEYHESVLRRGDFAS